MDQNILLSHSKCLTTLSSLGPLVRIALAFWVRSFINTVFGCVMPLTAATAPIIKGVCPLQRLRHTASVSLLSMCLVGCNHHAISDLWQWVVIAIVNNRLGGYTLKWWLSSFLARLLKLMKMGLVGHSSTCVVWISNIMLKCMSRSPQAMK